MDIVNIAQGASQRDFRTIYKKAVFQGALDRTVAEFGPYQLNSDGPTMTNKRAMQELSNNGSLINAYIAVTNAEWEKHAHVVRIPVRRGLLNYRLLLIHKDRLSLFENVETLDDLKRLRAGSQTHWVTTSVLKSAGFRVVEGSDYEGLFKMLSNFRFDFLLRGANEIFGELEQTHLDLENIVVEPSLALLIPSPVYVFVSPRSPRLIKRLEKGLELMVQDGSLKALFYQYHIDNVFKADLQNRRILEVTNPLLPEDTPLDRPELWYSIGEKIPSGVEKINIPPEY